jgi:ERCC4-type nuclease
MNGTIITIDSNEHSHHPEHFTELMKRGALCQVKSLPYDFEVMCSDGDVLAIERKTPRDFLESLKDRRLFNQVADMVNKTPWCYLAIEGWFEPAFNDTVIINELPSHINKKTEWTWASLQGALLSIQELGCVVVYDPDFCGMIERLVSRSRSDVKIAQRREPYIFSPAETIMMSLPGIGSKKAQEFLKLFNNNVALALTALTAPADGSIPGWKQKSRDNLIEALGGTLEMKNE